MVLEVTKNGFKLLESWFRRSLEEIIKKPQNELIIEEELENDTLI